jgi:hypothetical protein
MHRSARQVGCRCLAGFILPPKPRTTANFGRGPHLSAPVEVMVPQLAPIDCSGAFLQVPGIADVAARGGPSGRCCCQDRTETTPDHGLGSGGGIGMTSARRRFEAMAACLRTSVAVVQQARSEVGKIPRHAVTLRHHRGAVHIVPAGFAGSPTTIATGSRAAPGALTCTP